MRYLNNSNKELFDKFKELGLKLTHSGGIVQNCQIVSSEDINDFTNAIDTLLSDIEELKVSCVKIVKTVPVYNDNIPNKELQELVDNIYYDNLDETTTNERLFYLDTKYEV